MNESSRTNRIQLPVETSQRLREFCPSNLAADDWAARLLLRSITLGLGLQSGYAGQNLQKPHDIPMLAIRTLWKLINEVSQMGVAAGCNVSLSQANQEEMAIRLRTGLCLWIHHRLSPDFTEESVNTYVDHIFSDDSRTEVEVVADAEACLVSRPRQRRPVENQPALREFAEPQPPIPPHVAFPPQQTVPQSSGVLGELSKRRSHRQEAANAEAARANEARLGLERVLRVFDEIRSSGFLLVHHDSWIPIPPRTVLDNTLQQIVELTVHRTNGRSIWLRISYSNRSWTVLKQLTDRWGEQPPTTATSTTFSTIVEWIARELSELEYIPNNPPPAAAPEAPAVAPPLQAIATRQRIISLAEEI